MPFEPRPSRARRLRRALTCALTVSFLAGSGTASNDFDAGFPDDNATSHPAVDLLVLRPLGLVAFASGVGLFVPAGALTLITRPSQISEPFDWLVIEPARYVWMDPLGAH